MAARKLQTEIDRTLKKVSEGVELFESIYDKMQASTNQTQKEKLETDLKTQIKKLQRLRDQIKTWVASNEIKDKSQLLDNRKLIETQMEKFKACEKEMKTKAFSKDGLNAAQKLDPKEREKAEMTQWVATQVEELMRQVEVTEAEIEQLQGGTARSRRAKAAGGAGGRAEELATLNERRKWHVGRLEIVLRLLENNTLQTETVAALKEHISYFVESNTGEDFEFDEGVYDELNLDEEEEAFGIANDDNGSDGEEESVVDDRPSRPLAKDLKPKTSLEDDSHSRKDESSPVLKKAAPRKQSIHIEPKPPLVTQPSAPPTTRVSQPTAPTKVTLPPIRYAAAAAAAVKHDTPASKESPKPTPSIAHPPPAQSTLSSTQTASAPASAPSIASNPAPPTPSIPPSSTAEPSAQSSEPRSPSMASSIVSPAARSLPLDAPLGIVAQPHSRGESRHQSPVSSRAGVDPSLDAASAIISPLIRPLTNTRIQQALTSEPLPLNGSSTSANPGSNGIPPLPLPSTQPQLGSSMSMPSPLPQQVQAQGPPGFGYVDAQSTHSQNVAQQQQPQQPQQQRQLPSSLSDLVSTFEASKEKAARRDPEQISKALAAGFESMPQPQDTAKPKYYVPRNPFPSQPYYPQQPLAVLSSPALYSQLDVETLFFVFYYLPGTYMQYLAAKELKRQSWRFHVKYLTWFQRHSEPQAITDEYEQGVYVYFDWEGSWCQRKKSDFRFEYRHLSED
ncbi:general negative regulator of transcription subunit 5 [Ceratobasidium sp. 414]|nr:general negative regulator of transcription subunit 5 [Ceratobasidium sp. 414]